MKKRDKIILGIIAGTVCALIPIVFLSLAGRSKAVMAPAQVVMVEEETSEEVNEVESTEDMESFDETIETMPDEETTEEASTYKETQSETKVFEETSASNETSATSETQPSTEAQTEAVKETQKETVAETAAPTKAVETVPETTKAVETTAAPKVSSGDWNVDVNTINSVIDEGVKLKEQAVSSGKSVSIPQMINVTSNHAEYSGGGNPVITLDKSGNSYNLTIGTRLTSSLNQKGLYQILRLADGDTQSLYNAIYNSYEGSGNEINYNDFVDISGRKIKATNNGNSITYTIQ